MTWLTLIVRTLPLILRIAHRLSRNDYRRSVLVSRLRFALGDGRITQPEWAEIGHVLGVFKEGRR